MGELTGKQIRRIIQEIDRSGLTYTELQEELLDHLCCDVEAEMNEGLEFIKALEKVRKGIGENRIQDIQIIGILLQLNIRLVERTRNVVRTCPAWRSGHLLPGKRCTA